MKHSSSYVKNLVISIILLFSVLFSSALFANDEKDVILVLDTSLSMRGYGGKNILPQVKESINRYIDRLEDGDRVTFMTFDTKVRVFPPVIVDDDNDRDILKKYISMTEAKGQWTHTFQMIQSVFEKAQELEKEDDDDRQTMIVVMTDGIDDPPPYAVGSKFNLGNIASKYEGKDWWIYLVNFNQLTANEKIKKARERLQKQLEKVSKDTKIIDAGSDPRKGIEKDLAEDVQRRENAQSGMLPVLLLVIVIIAAVLGVIFYLKRQASILLSGSLEYWNNDILTPDIQSVDLTRYKARNLSVGKDYKANITLREFEASHSFTLEAVMADKEIKVAIHAGEGNKISFKNRNHGHYLKDGDMFTISNFTFKYLAKKGS